MKTLNKTRTVILLMVVFVCLITIGAGFISFQYFKTQKILSLGQRATSFAVALGANDIEQLSGDDSDLSNPAYITLKDKLIKLQQFNSDTRFVYLMGQSVPGQNDSDIFFFADSEDPNSVDYSPPGQVYDEASPIIRAVFSENKIQTEVNSDRWGKWLSVMAPITDKETGQVVALVGFDMTYTAYIREVIIFTMLPVSVGIAILILLFAALIYAKKDEDLMKLRSEYFAIAAHDLRTPLTGIKWAMGNLKKSLMVSAEKNKLIYDQITQSTENMLLSVNELLDGSSVEKPTASKLQLAKTDVVALLKNNLAALEMSAKEKKLKVIWQGPMQLFINGDSDKLHRVFANLLSNAIKYSKDNGTVKIVAKKTANNQAFISIKDSGIGIPVSEQEKVFKGYFRASNAKEFTKQGTGLGLYYVKNIVELHKGSIKLNSIPDKGTEFVLNFPIFVEKA